MRMHLISLVLIRCVVKSLISTSMYFALKYNQKKRRKLEKYFLGAKVWMPKLVYRSPKWLEYDTAVLVVLAKV